MAADSVMWACVQPPTLANLVKEFPVLEATGRGESESCGRTGHTCQGQADGGEALLSSSVCW